MDRVVVRIVTRHDPADNFSSSPGDEKRGVAVLEKGMFRPVEKRFSLEKQWRNPGGIVLIDFPRKFDEGVAFCAGSDLR